MTYSIATQSCVTHTSRKTHKSLSLGHILRVWTERRQLAAMDVSRLEDMGITPAQAAKEVARPIWDLR